jgi:hypothetical protein
MVYTLSEYNADMSSSMPAGYQPAGIVQIFVEWPTSGQPIFCSRVWIFDPEIFILMKGDHYGQR